MDGATYGRFAPRPSAAPVAPGTAWNCNLEELKAVIAAYTPVPADVVVATAHGPTPAPVRRLVVAMACTDFTVVFGLAVAGAVLSRSEFVCEAVEHLARMQAPAVAFDALAVLIPVLPVLGPAVLRFPGALSPHMARRLLAYAMATKVPALLAAVDPLRQPADRTASAEEAPPADVSRASLTFWHGARVFVVPFVTGRVELGVRTGLGFVVALDFDTGRGVSADKQQWHPLAAVQGTPLRVVVTPSGLGYAPKVAIGPVRFTALWGHGGGPGRAVLALPP